MRADATNSIVSGLSSRHQPPTATPYPRQSSPSGHAGEFSGQLRLNEVTAYFEVRNGDKVMYSLVEDATGHFLGQFSPLTGLGISAAIDEILKCQAATGDSTSKGE